MTIFAALTVQQVGPFAEKHIRLAPGLNLILGANESGKSTLARAVMTTLLGDVDADRLHRLGHHGEYGGAIRLETPTGAWVIDREYDSNQVRVSLVANDHAQEKFHAKVSPRGRSADVIAYRKLLSELFGVPDVELLPAIFAGERRLVLEGDAAARARQILNGQILHDHQAVREDLLDRYFSLTNINPDGRNRPKPRKIQLSRQTIDQLRERLSHAEQAYALLKQAEDQYNTAESRLTAIQDEAELQEQELQRLTEYFEAEQDIQEAAEKRKILQDDKDRVIKLKLKKEQVETETKRHAEVEAIDRPKLQLLRRRLSMLAIADQREKKATELKNTPVGNRRILLVGNVLFCLFLLIGSSIAVSLRPELYLTILLVAVVLLLPPLGWALRLWLQLRTIKQIKQARLEDLETDREQALAEADALTIGGGFDRLDRDELQQVIDDAEQLLELREECERVKSQIEVLPTIDDLNDALMKIDRETALLGEKTKTMKQEQSQLTNVSSDRITSVLSRIEALDEARQKAKTERDNALTQLARRRAEMENPQSLQDHLLDCEAELAEYEIEAAAAYKAVQALDEAIDRYMGEDLVRLADEAQRHFNRLTPGLSRRVTLDADLLPALTAESGQLPLDLLSAATGDQLLLACRLALLDHLSPENPLPLWIDDAAVAYDASRRQRFVELVVEAAQDRQIILSSADRHLSELLGDRANIVQLDLTADDGVITDEA